MDKKIVLAVAGSGKTKLIIDKLCLNKRHLIITYTINNEKNLRNRIKLKFGFFPSNINLTTYFPFLYKFCYRPFMGYKLRDRGLDMRAPPEWTGRIATIKTEHYLSNGKRLYHNRLGKLVLKYKSDFIISRLEKYYDTLFVDEFQDFAGNDYNVIELLVKASIEVLLVGDYYQHTYDTSRDGRTNINLHKTYEDFLKKCKKSKIEIDLTKLIKSWRCSKEVCKFVSENLGINIESNRKDSTNISVIYDKDHAKRIIEDDDIIKLFYSEAYKFDCFGDNWGAVKGLDDFNDVCVVMTKGAFDTLENSSLNDLKSITKSKLYVAITRTKGNLFFIHPDHLLEYKIF